MENEKTVKIKGLGTFKLIDVDSRESVNVNTGERFQIKGHTKVSFSPDTNLRDTINKPFAHFETVVLNENTILEDTPIEDTEEEEAEEETSAQTVLNEVGEGTAPLVTEEYESTDDELSEKELIQEEQITAQPSVKDSIEESVIIENVSTVEESIEPSSHVGLKETSTETDIEEKVEQLKDEEVPEEEVAIVEQEPTVPIIPSAKKETIKPVKLEQVSQPTSKKTASVKEKSPVPYLIAVIVIVLLLCGGVILFIYYPDLFSSSSDKNALDMPPVTTQPVQQETQLSDTIEQKDTIKEITPDAPKVVTPTSPVAQKEGTVPAKAEPQPAPRQPATSVYLDSASYKITGTKTKYTIKEGETLTKVSLRFYGTKAMWPYIVKHNPKAIKNPNNVPYGTIIEIPELTKE